MPSIEERVAYLEGRTGEYTGEFSQISLQVAAIEHRLTRVDAGLETLRAAVYEIDTRARMDRLEAKFDRLEEKLDRLFSQLQAQMGRQFTLLMGLQVATLIAFIGTLARLLYR